VDAQIPSGMRIAIATMSAMISRPGQSLVRSFRIAIRNLTLAKRANDQGNGVVSAGPLAMKTRRGHQRVSLSFCTRAHCCTAGKARKVLTEGGAE
jgi:hypothetical protein